MKIGHALYSYITIADGIQNASFLSVHSITEFVR